MKVEIKDLTTFQNCSDYSIGTVKHYCFNLNLKLHNGINFLLGSVMENGWLCSYVLAMAKKHSITQGSFYINDVLVDFNQIKRLSYYINKNEMKLINRKKTMKRFLYDDKLLLEFNIDSCIKKRRFISLSHWSYLCSCIIGLSRGKQILCFPWIPNSEVNVQAYRFNLLAEYAKKNDVIVVIPTDAEEHSLRKEVDYDCNIVIVK